MDPPFNFLYFSLTLKILDSPYKINKMKKIINLFINKIFNLFLLELILEFLKLPDSADL